MQPTDTEVLEWQGDLLLQRLGYYGFMTLVGVALPTESVIGSLLMLYGSARFVIVSVRLVRTVFSLRAAVHQSISHKPTPGLGRDASPGVARPADQGGTAGRASNAGSA